MRMELGSTGCLSSGQSESSKSVERKNFIFFLSFLLFWLWKPQSWDQTHVATLRKSHRASKLQKHVLLTTLIRGGLRCCGDLIYPIIVVRSFAHQNLSTIPLYLKKVGYEKKTTWKFDKNISLFVCATLQSYHATWQSDCHVASQPRVTHNINQGGRRLGDETSGSDWKAVMQ